MGFGLLWHNYEDDDCDRNGMGMHSARSMRIACHCQCRSIIGTIPRNSLVPDCYQGALAYAMVHSCSRHSTR